MKAPETVVTQADRLMVDFYVSPSYNPKARHGDTVKAAIEFALRHRPPPLQSGEIGELVEKLGELLAKATPGPWEARDETGMNDAWWIGFQDPTWGFLSIGETRSGCDEAGDRKTEDAALIVAAVNALPTLLATITALQAELASARKVVER